MEGLPLTQEKVKVMSAALLQGLGDIIRFSRESSRSGQYEAALAYLSGAIAKISQYVLHLVLNNYMYNHLSFSFIYTTA